MTSINRQPSSSTTKTQTTAAPPPTPPPALDDTGVEALPQTTSASTTTKPRATPEQIAAATTAAIKADDEESAADAASLLAGLPNPDFAAAMKTVASEPGRLEALLDNVPPSTKNALVRKLVTAGVLQPAAAPPTSPTPPKAPTPPPPPTIFKDDPSLPTGLRQLAVDENIKHVRLHEQQLGGYRAAYAAAVDKAPTVAALRALGPPQLDGAPAAMPSTTGAVGGPWNKQYQDALKHHHSGSDLQLQVNDKARTLSGRAVAGISVKASAEASVKVGGVSSFGVKAELGRAANGDVDGGAGATFGVGDFEVGVDNKGAISGKGKVGAFSVEGDEEGFELGFAGDGPPGSGPDDGHAVGLKLGKDGGAAKLEVAGTGGSVGFDKEKGAIVGGKLAGLGGTAGFNGDSISYGLEAERSIAVGDSSVELKGELSIGLQGVTKADRDAFVSTSNVGFYTQPSAQLLEIPWSHLPDDVRDAFKNQMWTEPEWRAAGKRSSDLTLRR